MKTAKIISTAFLISMAMAITGCEGEKDLIIIDGDLPIKTSTLYIVGDATPCGWDIDNPIPMEVSDEDPLVFTWDGTLQQGELKLCLNSGSWDAPFIRPLAGGTPISREDITDARFKMNAGNPDDKWVVSDAGMYHLEFDLRNWTMNTRYLSEPEKPAKEPIAAENVYIVGDATPCGWNIDSPLALEKLSDNIFRYDGVLNPGEMKACISTGDWNTSFIRPLTGGVEIGKNGVANPDFTFSASPDNKWNVVYAGHYQIDFDLNAWTISVTFKGEVTIDKTPIETETLYMIGDATPNGWDMDTAQEFTRDASDKYVFTWEGELVEGTFKACTERDGTFSCPFIRPESADVTVTRDGVSSTGFVYTTSPDVQWQVKEPGRYRIRFNLSEWTIYVEGI